MPDPNRPQLDRVVRAAMRDLDRKERGVPKDLPRGRRMYLPSGVRSYMSETSDDYKAFITPPDVGLARTSEDDTTTSTTRNGAMRVRGRARCLMVADRNTWMADITLPKTVSLSLRDRWPQVFPVIGWSANAVV